MDRPLTLESRFFKVQIKHILPNAVTVLSLCAGMTALIFTADGRFDLAVACVLLAAVLDACDGRVARATGGASKFGAELDSLADVVCFGVAPAFVLFEVLLAPYFIVGWLACLMLLAASALRLARFNVTSIDVTTPKKLSHVFTGIPAPAGAFLALLPLYFMFGELASAQVASRIALFSTPLVAFLMVSELPTFSMKSMSSRTLRFVVVPVFMVGVVLTLVQTSHWHGLVTAGVVYVLSLPVSFWLYHEQMTAMHVVPPSETGGASGA